MELDGDFSLLIHLVLVSAEPKLNSDKIAVRLERRAQEESKILTEQLQAANSEKAQLAPIVEENSRAQQELDELYKAIFGGQNVSYPEEDQQEMIVEKASVENEQLQFSLSREQQVMQLLVDAGPAMVKALDSVENAVKDSQADQLGGGGLWEFMERRDIDKTDEAINEVHRLVVQAQQLSPEVQPLGTTEIAEGSFMSDALFDNIFADHDFHQKLKQSRDELAKAAEKLQANRDQAEKRIQSIQAQSSKALRQLEEERAKLQKIRERIFERMLDSM